MQSYSDRKQMTDGQGLGLGEGMDYRGAGGNLVE